jgi:hypothetical protein
MDCSWDVVRIFSSFHERKNATTDIDNTVRARRPNVSKNSDVRSDERRTECRSGV